MAPRRNHNNSSSIVQHHHLQHQQQQQQSLLITTSSSATFYNDLEEDQQQQQQQHYHQQQPNLLENCISFNTSNNNNNNTMSPMHTSCNNTGNTNGIITSNNATNNSNNEQQQQQYTRCCYPNGDCLKIDALISLNDLNDCVRVLCNNENCNVGQYMHRECFDSWEQSVLNTLKSIGRARSWSERQRSQNLWTKKGYDLVYKACGCKCGRGHLRKDLEWTPASGMKNALHYVNGNSGNVIGGTTNGQRVALSNGNAIVNGNNNNNNNNNNNSNNNNNNNNEDDDKKKKKKRNRNNQVKTTVPLTPLQQQNGYANNQQQGQTQHQQSQHNMQSTPQQNCQNNIITTQLMSNTNNNQSNNSNNSNNNILEIMPNPNVGVIGSGLHNNNNNNTNNNINQQNNANQQSQQQKQNVVTLNNLLNGNNTTIANNILGLDLRARAGSLSSSGAGSGSTSPAASQSSIDISISPIHKHQQQHIQQLQQYDQQHAMQQQQLNSFSKRLLNGISSNLLVKQPQALQSAQQHQQQQQQQQISNSFKQLSAFDQQQLILQQKVKEVEIYSERVRSTSGCNGIFSRRLDFSSFNLLPKTRLNSYQVKIEDEGNHGNDETRLFILSSLAQSQRSRVACILCEEPMLVFDRYPLVDGSFFLSPKQHSSGCIEVKYEGRSLYLTCVCMSCLDGSSSNRVISCRFCAEIWDGSNLVLGTMYAYDIFAAMPCCAERLKCNNCFKLLLHPQQRLSFYSDYSHCVTCPYCATQDTHFVKPLTYCFTKSTVGRLQQIA